jgi:hypothetical protein
LRLALKAQAQSRATLETLAEMKFPNPATFVRQQNVALQQQVNNGAEGNKETSTHTHAQARGKSENRSNELLEQQHGKWLDTGTAGEASGTYQNVETMETVNRSADTRR